MKKINIAELLKDCPKGMELDCTMFDNVSFIGLQDSSFPIIIHTPDGCKFLTPFGCYHDSCSAKCVIFPKGKNTWEGFTPLYKFKNADVIIKNNFIAIISHIEPNGRIWYHCWYDTKYKECKIKTDFGIGCINDDDKIRFATEEEKARLFDTINANGYKWNPKIKVLEKLTKPRFKVGDRVRGKYTNNIYTISGITLTGYELTNGKTFTFNAEDCFELAPDKFDISTLVPFESRVLVRDYSYEAWRVSFWGCLINSEHGFKYDTIRGPYKQCIPYKGNEYLLGKTDDCKDFYKTWEL